MSRLFLLAWLAGLLAGCAGYSGYGLQPGQASEAETVTVMGQPALSWTLPDGARRLAFPRGPQGLHTYMADFGPDGRLQRLENVLDMAHFARIRPGRDTQEDILRLLGPPYPGWTVYFAARDELVWEWAFCDEWRRRARFNVLFDGKTGLVRSTLQRRELHGLALTTPFCGG